MDEYKGIKATDVTYDGEGKFSLDDIVMYGDNLFVIVNVMFTDSNISTSNYMYLLKPINDYGEGIEIQNTLVLEEYLEPVSAETTKMLGMLYEKY